MLRSWTQWSSWIHSSDTIITEVLQCITNIPTSNITAQSCAAKDPSWHPPQRGSAAKHELSPFQSCLCASGRWEVWRDLPVLSASCPLPLRSGAPAPAGLHGPKRKGIAIRLNTLTRGIYNYWLNAQPQNFWGEILSSSQEVWGEQG